MKTKRAGMTDAPIIQVGNGCLSPKGLMNQFLLSGEVTEKPDGTLSFCKQTKKKTNLLVRLVYYMLSSRNYRDPLNVKQDFSFICH